MGEVKEDVNADGNLRLALGRIDKSIVSTVASGDFGSNQVDTLT